MQMKSSLVKFLNESFAFSLAKLLFNSFLIILLVLPIYPQQSHLKFKKLTSNDGLSQNFVSSILQDKNGFMWFGTKDGLNRYDGYEFKIYRHNPFDAASLSGNYISTLFEDSKERLWVASNTLDLFIPEKDAFKRIVLKIPTNKTDSTININKITSITEDKNGLIWLGTNDG
jgi:ligand-binding sensor domain-containing protein